MDEIGVDMIALLISWFGARAGERRAADGEGKIL
jgi:hypothetical protein